MVTLSRDAIRLTTDEEKLFECLDKFVAQVRASQPEHAALEARIAGGWVRDKLLQQTCLDCDVAIANMKGLDFAQRFVPFYQDYYHLSANKIRISEIKANPEQSKHLDTATVSLLGQGDDHRKMDLDFVQLRSEEYGEGSRIPTEVSFGTPLQDALRRDLTINALFYNVHTRQIEDHTEKGLSDLLQTPLIRTPLEPRQTFLDDPLRILRCIRFAVRLGFPLHDDIRRAVVEPEIRDALAKKVSRERVGIEVKKMLQSKGARQAIDLIVDLGLYDIVFTPPPHPPAPAPGGSQIVSPSVAKAAARTLQEMLSLDSQAHVFATLPRSLIDGIRASLELYLACSLLPYRGQTYQPAKRGMSGSVPRYIVSHSLKLSNDESDQVNKLYEATTLLSSRTIPNLRGPEEPADLGVLLTRISAEKGPSWRESILFCLLVDILPHIPSDPNKVTDLIADYDSLMGRIMELGLATRAFERTMLTGNDAMAQGIAPMHRKAYLEQVKRWQLLHPGGSREACLEHMQGWESPGSDVREAKKPRQR